MGAKPALTDYGLLLKVCRSKGCRIVTVRRVNSDKNAKKLGNHVRRLRDLAGISQEELAERCGLHRTYVGSVERGERNISLDNIVLLSRALGVKPTALLEGL